MAVVQEFLDVFQIPLRRRVAAREFEATKLRVGGAVLDLAATVRSAFVTHQAALQTQEMRQSVVEATAATVLDARRSITISAMSSPWSFQSPPPWAPGPEKWVSTLPGMMELTRIP